MNNTDYVIIAGLAISCIAGALRGFLREAIAVMTWLAAAFIAWHFSDLIEPNLGGALAEASTRPWAARAILFVLVLVTGTIIGAVAGHFVRLSMFSGTDRLLGFLFGFVRGALILGTAVMLGHAARLQGESWWRESKLVPYAEHAGNVLRSLVGERKIRSAARGADRDQNPTGA